MQSVLIVFVQDCASEPTISLPCLPHDLRKHCKNVSMLGHAVTTYRPYSSLDYMDQEVDPKF